MLVPTVLGQRWDRVDGGCHPWTSSQGRGPGSTLDGLAPVNMLVPTVLGSGGWWCQPWTCFRWRWFGLTHAWLAPAGMLVAVVLSPSERLVPPLGLLTLALAGFSP